MDLSRSARRCYFGPLTMEGIRVIRDGNGARNRGGGEVKIDCVLELNSGAGGNGS